MPVGGVRVARMRAVVRGQRMMAAVCAAVGGAVCPVAMARAM